MKNETMNFFKVSMAAFLLVGALLLAQGGTASAAPKHGAYNIVDEVSPSEWNRSFDYDASTQIFTLYDDKGAVRRLDFSDFWNNRVTVEELRPENKSYSGVYEMFALCEGKGPQTLPAYIIEALSQFDGAIRGETNFGVEDISVMADMQDGKSHTFTIQKAK